MGTKGHVPHVCDDDCPRPDMSDLPDTDDTLRALEAPPAGWRRVLVCHPIEADYVAAAVEEQLGAVDLVRCEVRDQQGTVAHSDASATTSVHATERVPAGKMFTWTGRLMVSPEDRARWTNAPGAAPERPTPSPTSSATASGPPEVSPRPRGEQGALAFT